MFIAEREGFEPPEVLPSTVFKTAAIDHSAISPKKFFPLPRLGFCVAERTRFELVVGLLLRQFSKLVVSATHPPLHFCRSSFAFAIAKVERFFKSAKFSGTFFQEKLILSRPQHRRGGECRSRSGSLRCACYLTFRQLTVMLRRKIGESSLLVDFPQIRFAALPGTGVPGVRPYKQG